MPRHKDNTIFQLPEKTPLLTLQIRKARNKTTVKNHYIKDIDINKLATIDQHHRTHNTKPTWKLSEDKTKLLLT